MGSRQGFFLYASKGLVAIHPWDTTNEEISGTNTLSADQTKELVMALHRGELNKNLGPYPLTTLSTWSILSSHITHSVLHRADVMPGVLIYPGDADDIISAPLAQADPFKDNGRCNDSVGNIRNIKDHGQRRWKSDSETSQTAVKPYFPNLARVARFSDIVTIGSNLRENANSINSMREDDDNPSSDLRARRLMSLSLDKSSVLRELVKNAFEGSWDDLLGELQLSFILFMFLYSQPALEHWKLLVYTICYSENVLLNELPFAPIFIKTLYAQLNFCPDDFFDNELSRDNFLRPSLSALFSALNSADASADVVVHKRRLFTFVKKKFNLYDSDNDDSIFGKLRGYMLPLSRDTTPGFVNGREEKSPASIDIIGQDNCNIQRSAWQESLTYISTRDQVYPSTSYTDVDILYNLVDEDMPTIVYTDELSFLGVDNEDSKVHHADKLDEDYEIYAQDVAEVKEPPKVSSATSLDGVEAAENCVRSELHNNDAGKSLRKRWELIHSAMNTILPTSSRSHAFDSQVPQSSGSEIPAPNHDIDERLDAQSNHHSFPSYPRHDVNSHEPSHPQLSHVEVEAGLFSWRYPHLFDEMVASAGKEDMIMTAMRILSTDDPSFVSPIETLQSGHNGGTEDARVSKSISKLLAQEAHMFIEYEVQKRPQK